MPRPHRRSAFSPRVDSLEPRRLLSTGDPGRADLLVRFKATAGPIRVDSLLVSVRAEVVRSYTAGPTLISVPAGSAAKTLRKLDRSPLVAYAQRDAGIARVAGIPSDGQFARQWGLNQANNVDIDAPQAWNVTTGSAATIVAVIDSGLDVDHPEFAGRLWTNPAEAADGTQDADRNGLVGDVHGWNFVTNTADISDDNGHGTHVAGILAATGNNGVGVAGVDWNARLMILKTIDGEGGGSIDAAIRAIYYAVDHGARVINASWSGNFFSRPLADAVRYAASRNVVVVTAAGNADIGTMAANNDQTPSYPANFQRPNILSVAAIDSRGKLASFSNYGAKTVTLAAPGAGILSTVPGGYDVYSGTSMATPYVSGVASLLIGLHPEMTAKQVVNRISHTVKPLAGLKGKTITGGMVDAYQAILGKPGVNLSGKKGKAAPRIAAVATPKLKVAAHPAAAAPQRHR